MDAGKDIFVAILIYSIGRFIIRQISILIAKVLEKRKIEVSVQTFLKSLVKILLNMVLAFAIISKLGVETTSFAALLLLSYQDRARGQIKCGLYIQPEKQKKIYRLFRIMVLCIQTFPQMNLQ
jgi:hypothetical protein